MSNRGESDTHGPQRGGRPNSLDWASSSRNSNVPDFLVLFEMLGQREVPGQLGRGIGQGPARDREPGRERGDRDRQARRPAWSRAQASRRWPVPTTTASRPSVRNEVRVRSGKSSDALGRGRYSSNSQVFFSDSTSSAGRRAEGQLGGDHPRLVLRQLPIDVGGQVRALLGAQTLLGPDRHSSVLSSARPPRPDRREGNCCIDRGSIAGLEELTRARETRLGPPHMKPPMPPPMPPMPPIPPMPPMPPMPPPRPRRWPIFAMLALGPRPALSSGKYWAARP